MRELLYIACQMVCFLAITPVLAALYSDRHLMVRPDNQAVKDMDSRDAWYEISNMKKAEAVCFKDVKAFL